MTMVWNGTTFVEEAEAGSLAQDTGQASDQELAALESDVMAYLAAYETVLSEATNTGVTGFQSLAAGSAGTVTDLTGLSISFDVVSRPVLVVLWMPWVVATLASGFTATTIAGYISDAAGVAKSGGARTISQTGGIAAIRAEERITTPGSYTRKGQFHRFGGNAAVSNNLSGSALTMSRITAFEQ